MRNTVRQSVALIDRFAALLSTPICVGMAGFAPTSMSQELECRSLKTPAVNNFYGGWADSRKMFFRFTERASSISTRACRIAHVRVRTLNFRPIRTRWRVTVANCWPCPFGHGICSVTCGRIAQNLLPYNDLQLGNLSMTSNRNVGSTTPLPATPQGPLSVMNDCWMVGHRNPESMLQCNTYIRKNRFPHSC